MATPTGMNIPKDYFQFLPKEIKQLLALYLNKDDLAVSASTSKVFLAITSDNRLWLPIAKKYDIKLKNPSNAKKEILELFYNVHNLNVLALKALEAQRYKVDWGVVFSEQPNPIVLHNSLKAKVGNPAVQSYLRDINAALIAKLGMDIPLTGVNPEVTHEKIINYTRENLNKLQPKGLEILKEAYQKQSHSPKDVIVFEALIRYGIVGNNPSVSKKSNKDYWQEVFDIALGNIREFPAMAQTNALFDSILVQFKNASCSPIEKFEIINRICNFFNSPDKQNLILKIMKFFPNDESLLRGAIIHDFNSKTMSIANLTLLFINNSSLTEKELLKIIDDIEQEIVKKESKIFLEEDKKDVEAGREPESRTLAESIRSAKFESLRKIVRSRVKGLDD